MSTVRSTSMTLFWMLLALSGTMFASSASESPSEQRNAIRMINQDCPSVTSSWNVPESGDVCGAKRNSMAGVQVTCDSNANIIGLEISYMLSCPFARLTRALQRLPELQSLKLYRTGTKGQLPNQWSKLTKLRELSITDTEVEGTLPKRWKALKNLEKLHVKGTDCCLGHITGALPGGYYRMSRLNTLDLSFMRIEATIPEAWGKFPKLEKLDLSVNWNLTGTIPSSFDGLTSIREMHFTSTGVVGPLPESLSSLTGLRTMDMSYCRGMCGDVPQGLKAKVVYDPKPCPVTAAPVNTSLSG